MNEEQLELILEICGEQLKDYLMEDLVEHLINRCRVALYDNMGLINQCGKEPTKKDYPRQRTVKRYILKQEEYPVFKRKGISV